MKAAYLEPEIVTRKGKPVSVILPIKDYEELLERVEDAEDVAWLKKARRKKLQYRVLSDEDKDIAEALRRDAAIEADPAKSISLPELDSQIQSRRG
jgi:prevent-host-death family protein